MTRITRLAVLFPRRIVALWLAVTVVLTIVGAPLEDKLAPPQLVLSGGSAAVADDLRGGHFGEDTIVLLQGPGAALDARGPAIVKALVAETHAPLVSPWSGPERAGDPLHPRPGLALIAVDLTGGDDEVGPGRLEDFTETVGRVVRPPLTATLTGEAPLRQAIADESIESAGAAEKIAIPSLLLVLLLVFRSVVAAAIPLMVAGATVLAGRGVLVLMAEVVHLDAVCAVLLSMIGLALGVDYSLLIVTRFREALADGEPPGHAVTLAAHTAGRTATFAGVVLTAILGVTLLLAPGGALVSAVAGALVATSLSVLSALVATPALLMLFARRIKPLPGEGGGLLGRIVGGAIAHPRWALLAAVPLLALGLGALKLDTTPPDPRVLPEGSPGARALVALGQAGLGPGFDVVVHRPQGPLTEPATLAAERRFERSLARVPSVRAVAGPGGVDGAPAAAAAATRRRAVRADTRRAQHGLTLLRRGLVRAEASAAEVSAGAAAVRDDDVTAAAVAQAAADAGVGARMLATGLADAASDARRLRADGDRLSRAAVRAAASVRALVATLRDRLTPRLDALGGSLANDAGALGALRDPAAEAARHAESALDGLRDMSAGRLDPRYGGVLADLRDAVTALRRGATAGGGTLLDELGAASERAGAAAGAARSLAGDSRSALRTARDVRNGIRDVEHELATLRPGAVAIAGDLRGLERVARATASGTPATAGAEPAAPSTAALGRLRARTERLAAGLTVLRARERALTRALGRAAPTPAPTAPTGGSGFASLAAVDTSAPVPRAAARYLLDVDGGGGTARIALLTDLAPADPRAGPALERIESLTRRFARATGTEAAVGGQAAQLHQFDEATRSRLPLIVAGVALITFLALVAVLRSLLVAAIAVGLNLLTVLTMFGALTLLFVGDDPVLGQVGALDVITVVSVFAITFALSIDYQVFLLARMREGFVLTQDRIGAIRFGIEHTGRIVTGAALIMLGVFAAFATTDVASVQQFGVGLGVAIVADATLVRLVLLPAIMAMAGRRTWWLPDRMERGMPEFDIEGVGFVRSRSELGTRAAEVW